MMDNLDLYDIWREFNPECRRFTWRRKTPFQQSRLDFFLVSESILSVVDDADILCGYRTDHSLVKLVLQFGQKETKRKSFWKFNASLLKDQLYLDEVNKLIDDIVEEYAASPYSREEMFNLNKSDIKFTIDDDTFLDFLLMKIRSHTISYATMKKRKENEKEKKIDCEINELEKINNRNEYENETLEQKKEELEKLREKRMEGVLLRSRAQWIADGEKVSVKLLLQFGKKGTTLVKIMTKIKDNDGTEITDQAGIKNRV
jgi:hypothetical protein